MMTNENILKDLWSLKDVIAEGKDGDFLAIGDDGKDYKASYNAKLKVMFFAIPSTVNVLGYLKVIGRK